MRGNLQVIVSTVVLFMAGLLVGIWTQRMRPIPPPPMGPMGEFARRQPRDFERFAPPPPSSWFAGQATDRRPPDPDQIRKRLEELAPEFAAFQEKIDGIEKQFRDSVNRFLRPDQKQKLDTIEQRLGQFPDPLPGCTPGMGPIFVSMVIYRPMLERLSEDLELNEDQQKQLRDLLAERRDKLIALVDRTPPPSFKFPDLVSPNQQ